MTKDSLTLMTEATIAEEALHRRPRSSHSEEKETSGFESVMHYDDDSEEDDQSVDSSILDNVGTENDQSLD